jgi:hypothetical protein
MSFLKYVSALLLTIFSLNAQAGDRVEFSADRIHGLFVFVETIAGNPHRSVDLKNAYEKSKFNTAASKQQLDSFKSLDFVLNKFLEFEGLPERNMGNSARSILVAQSSFSKNLDDFRERSVSVIPLPDLKKLMQVLRYFEPIYDSLIWNPHKAELAKVAAEFKAKSKKWKLDDLFARATKFYGAQWPEDQAFRVSLYPIPPKSQYSSSQAYGAVESVGIIIGDKDREGRFGVIFHEMCHSLYEAQPMAIQKLISEKFKLSKSKYALLAYSYLNEALATASGNGWAFLKAKGKVDSQEWYHEEKIEGFARAIYPLVSEYLNTQRVIDPPFIESAIISFQKKFPDSNLEFGPALNDLVLLGDGVINLRDFRSDLRSTFRIASMTASSPINDDETLKLVRSVPSTVLAIVTQKQRGQIDTLDEVFKGISEHIELLPPTGNFLAMFDVGVRKVIVIIVDDPALVPKAFKIMAQKKKVDKLDSFVELKFQP